MVVETLDDHLPRKLADVGRQIDVCCARTNTTNIRARESRSYREREVWGASITTQRPSRMELKVSDLRRQWSPGSVWMVWNPSARSRRVDSVAAAAREKSVSQEAACKIIARRTTKSLEDAGDPLAPESTTARQRGGQSGR